MELAVEGIGGLEGFEDAVVGGEFAGDGGHLAGGAGAAVEEGDAEGG